MQDYWINEEGFPFIVTEFISGKRVTDLVKAAGGKPIPTIVFFSASKLQSELEAQGFKAQISRT